MSESRRHRLLNFPSIDPSHDGRGTLPDSSVDDEALVRDMAEWTVPPASDESRERLLTAARVELAARARMAARSGHPRLTLPEPARRRWPLMAMVSTLLIAVATSFWWGSVTVSADEALSRAERAETRLWLSTPRPIVHQRIELRVARSGSRHDAQWDSWSESSGKVHHFTTDRPAQRSLVSRYLDTLARNGLDQGPPLSAVAFARWRDSLPDGTGREERLEHVETPDMGPALRIHVRWPTPHLPGRIVNASVLLRTSDWHPIEQVIHVRTSDGDVERFDLTERHSVVVSRDTLPDISLGDTIAAPAKKTDTAAALATVSQADLADVETQVLFALHRLRADLGEQIEVVRRAQDIEIRGVVDTADRLAVIDSAMSRIPHTRLSIVHAGRAAASRVRGDSSATAPAATAFNAAASSTTGPATRGPGTTAPAATALNAATPVTAGASTSAPVVIERIERTGDTEAAGEPPLWRFVDAYLRNGQAKAGAAKTGDALGHADAATSAVDATARARAINVFVQDVNTEAEAAVADAWALRRLTERYPLEKRQELAEPSRQRLEEMTRDHLTSIQGRVSKLRRALEPVDAAARARRGRAAGSVTATAPSRDARDARDTPDAPGAPHLARPQVFLAVIDVERRLAELVLSDRHGALPADDDEAVLDALARLLSSLTRLEHDLQLLVEQG